MKALFTLTFALALAATAVHAGTLKLDSYGTGFGKQELGITVISDPITITNFGTPTTLQLPLQVSGPGASQFSIIQPATATLGDGESVIFRVRFQPTAVGAYEAKIVINSNATNSSIETSYAGACVTGPPSPTEIAAALLLGERIKDALVSKGVDPDKISLEREERPYQSLECAGHAPGERDGSGPAFVVVVPLV